MPIEENSEGTFAERASGRRGEKPHRRPPTGRGAASLAPSPSPDAPPADEPARVESFAARLFAQRWSLVAGLCLLVAALVLVWGRMDAAFVVATLGVVAWFWNERNRLRPHDIEADDRFQDDEDKFEDRDEV